MASWGRSHQLLSSSCSQALRTSSDPLTPPLSPSPSCRNRKRGEHSTPAQGSFTGPASYPRLPLFKLKACLNIRKTDLGWLNLFCSSQHDHITAQLWFSGLLLSSISIRKGVGIQSTTVPQAFALELKFQDHTIYFLPQF